jgi:hypothetical protein
MPCLPSLQRFRATVQSTSQHITSYGIASGKAIDDIQMISVECLRVTGSNRRGTDFFGSGFTFGDGYLLCRSLDFRD